MDRFIALALNMNYTYNISSNFQLGGPAGEPAFQKCEEQCKYHFESSGDQFQSTNFNSETLGHYRPFSNCKWTLEGPRGTTIALRVTPMFQTYRILKLNSQTVAEHL